MGGVGKSEVRRGGAVGQTVTAGAIAIGSRGSPAPPREQVGSEGASWAEGFRRDPRPSRPSFFKHPAPHLLSVFILKMGKLRP